MLVALAVLVVVEVAGAQELVGTWVPVDLKAEILARRPGSVRLLVIRTGSDGLIVKVVIPTLSGAPVAVEQHGDRVRLTIRMARGMETPLEATLTADRLSVAPAGSTQPPAVRRRASAEESQLLKRLAPKKLPLRPVRALPANGLARTPPMRFSTWDHFQTAIDDRIIRDIADALVATGMRDAGYVYVNIDDGWQGERDVHGTLRPNAKFHQPGVDRDRSRPARPARKAHRAARATRGLDAAARRSANCRRALQPGYGAGQDRRQLR
jgi:hypothetical protein